MYNSVPDPNTSPIPRYHLYLNPERVEQGETIRSTPDGVWCKWKEVEPLVYFAIANGAPLTNYLIPEGVARGADGEDTRPPLHYYSDTPKKVWPVEEQLSIFDEVDEEDDPDDPMGS